MDSKDMVEKAILLASEAHAKDNWGEFPYMTHLALTAYEARKLSNLPLVEAAAWLHDVIEDHPEYEERVRSDFPDLIDVLLMDSRKNEETYSAYIDRLIRSNSTIALSVKYADMKVNLSNNPPARLIERYSIHIGRLRDALNKLGIVVIE